MPLQTAKLQHRRHRTIPQPQDTELQHPFFRNTFSAINSCLDYAGLSIIPPILVATVAIILFLSFIIPVLVVVSIWIEEGLYTIFDTLAAVWGGYILGM